MEDPYQADTRILGGLLRDRHLATTALNEGFYPDLLTLPLARRLAKIILEVHALPGAALDEPTLRARLIDHGLATPEMEIYFKSVLQQPPMDAAEIVSQIDLLKARESRRLLAHVHRMIGAFLERADPLQGDVIHLTSEAIDRLLEIQRQRTRRHMRPIAHQFDALEAESSRTVAGGVLGFSISPFDRLNAALSGLRRGFYYGLAGAPRRGKTNLALDLACHVAANHQIPVLYYTWEQICRVLAARLIGKETGINPATILAGADEHGSVAPRIAEAKPSLMRYGPYLHLIEAGRKDTHDRIRAHALNLMQEFQTENIAIFLDYLQKIPLREHVEDWRARTDQISTALAELSLELNCPVFAISPLDKEGCRLDERPVAEADIFDAYTRPTMHHSMGGGDLEYDLDVAMVLAKDWKATEDLEQLIDSRAKAEGFEPAQLPKVDIVNLFIDKNRDAPEVEANTVQYAFFITLNKFVELGYKTDAEYRPDYHGFTKLQDIYIYLRDRGYGPRAGDRAGEAGGVHGTLPA